MKKLVVFLKAGLMGGIIFMLPIVVITMLISRILQILEKITKPLLPYFPRAPLGGIGIATILEISIFALMCLLAGWLSTTQAGKRFYGWTERTLLQFIPGYSMARSFLFDLTGQREESNVAVVLAWIEEAWQLAFLIEKLDSGLLTVFIPEVPSSISGTIYYLTPERVKYTDLPVPRAYGILRRYGAGSAVSLKNII